MFASLAGVTHVTSYMSSVSIEPGISGCRTSRSHGRDGHCPLHDHPTAGARSRQRVYAPRCGTGRRDAMACMPPSIRCGRMHMRPHPPLPPRPSRPPTHTPRAQITRADITHPPARISLIFITCRRRWSRITHTPHERTRARHPPTVVTSIEHPLPLASRRNTAHQSYQGRGARTRPRRSPCKKGSTWPPGPVVPRPGRARRVSTRARRAIITPLIIFE